VWSLEVTPSNDSSEHVFRVFGAMHPLDRFGASTDGALECPYNATAIFSTIGN
jgi:hypothetical protein